MVSLLSIRSSTLTSAGDGHDDEEQEEAANGTARGEQEECFSLWFTLL